MAFRSSLQRDARRHLWYVTLLPEDTAEIDADGKVFDEATLDKPRTPASEVSLNLFLGI